MTRMMPGARQSDARGQPSTAFVAAGSVGGTVARAGVDIARLREKSFRERPRLGLLEMEAACIKAPVGRRRWLPRHRGSGTDT